MQLSVHRGTSAASLTLSQACLVMNSFLAEEVEIYNAGAFPDITGSFTILQTGTFILK
jgi:hypothetical protein